MKKEKKSTKNVDTKKTMTLDALKAAAKSVTTEAALAKIVGGTLADCHLTDTLS